MSVRQKKICLSKQMRAECTWTSSPNTHHRPWEHILHISLDETLADNCKCSETSKITVQVQYPDQA